MYLYAGFVNENAIHNKRYFLKENFLEPVKGVFPNFKELNNATISGCIGYIKDKTASDKNCYILDISNLKVDENSLSFDFKISIELTISNNTINKSLYKLAQKSNWIIKESGYYPLLCIMNKADFDTVRKGMPNARKITNNTANIDELKANSDWEGICNIYEPLERVNEITEVWDNVSELYELAFACSKLGEPQNGMEQDRIHLIKVKRYRELSISFFLRCIELEPNDFRYTSALAYRYYLNVMELTKPKGRSDGKIIDEIEQALKWLNKALELNPKSIKDNYRKGKLIIDKQTSNFKYSSHQWTKETFDEIEYMESEATKSLTDVIELYEQSENDEYKKRYHNEYVKALYTLACFYMEKPKNHWNEYACCKIANKTLEISFKREDMQYIAKAKDLLEKCFRAETEIDLHEDFDITKLTKLTNQWNITPMDKLYRLGLIYLEMYFIKKIINNDLNSTVIYKENSKKYLMAARHIGEEMKRSKIAKRDTWFISEKIAWYYIISDQFNDAIQIIERGRAGYVINTCAVALLLSGQDSNVSKARESLKSASMDRYNLAKNLSVPLLAFIYHTQGNAEELTKLLVNQKGIIKGSSKRFLSIFGLNEGIYEN